MNQLFGTILNRTFEIMRLNFLKVFIVLFLFAGLNIALAHEKSSDECYICYSTTVISPVCLAALQEEFNLEKMVLETKFKKVCQHIFCKECIEAQMSQGTFYHYCDELFTDVLPIDFKAEVISERIVKDFTEETLKDLSWENLNVIFLKLLESEALDTAFEMIKSIPNLDYMNIELEGLSDLFDLYDLDYVNIKLKDSRDRILISIDSIQICIDKKIISLDIDEIFKLVIAYIEKDNLDKALEVVKMIPNIQHLNFHDSFMNRDYVYEKNYCYYFLIDAFIEKGNLEKAVEILDNDLRFPELKDPDEDEYSDYIEFLLYSAKAYLGVKKQDKALGNLNKALEVMKLADIGGYCEVYFYLSISDIYIAAGKLDDALEILDKAVKTSENFGDGWSRATALVDISKEYIEAKEKDRALELLNTATEIAESISDDYWDKKQAFISIMTGYFKAKKIEKTLESLSKALEVDTRFLNEKELSFVIRFTDYIKDQKLDLALEVLRNSLDLVESIFSLEERDEEKAIYPKIVEEGTLYFQNYSQILNEN